MATGIDAPEQEPRAAAEVDLGQALGALLRRYLEGARGAVEALPGGPRGFQVLSTAAEGACGNQATIALRLGLDRTVMTHLVDDLESAGMVSRVPDPNDRRARQVILTAKGSRTLRSSSERIRGVERDVLGGLSDDEAELFRSLLARVTADEPTDHSACSAPVSDC
ncbi:MULTISPECIES: MarR family winged helix-turn-helix transcriptional regulator [unclassified Knoellia]|uniref:MarR family winged helix-turn-helix transcriptional regulator n=1 Tax=Knoellia altitudinis TaxID=3404795 RepID=UPI00360D2595